MAQDLIQQGLDWFETQRKEHMSRTVTYVWPSGASADVQATVGKTTYESTVKDNVVIEVQVRDYILAVADLTFSSGQEFRPEKFDLIRETRDGTTYEYEVLDLPGQNEYSFVDPDQKVIRIHTKFNGTL